MVEFKYEVGEIIDLTPNFTGSLFAGSVLMDLGFDFSGHRIHQRITDGFSFTNNSYGKGNEHSEEVLNLVKMNGDEGKAYTVLLEVDDIIEDVLYTELAVDGFIEVVVLEENILKGDN